MEAQEELQGSELGTLQHWQAAYRRELRNYDRHGDPGEVWFGEDIVTRVVRWMLKCPEIQASTRIIDLGCGNGYSLLELAREEFTDLTGVDYSVEAITLAQKVAREEFPNIVYKVFDITKDDPSTLGGKFGVVHDKGTYDAVSLNPDDPKTQRLRYIEKVVQLLHDSGLFIITSCNWTDSELVEHFKEKLQLKCVIPTPQFMFGGKVGNVVSSVVFIKK